MGSQTDEATLLTGNYKRNSNYRAHAETLHSTLPGISTTAVVKSNDQNLHKLCFCAFLLVHCAQLTVYPFKEPAPLAACCPHGKIQCVPEKKYLISL